MDVLLGEPRTILIALDQSPDGAAPPVIVLDLYNLENGHTRTYSRKRGINWLKGASCAGAEFAFDWAVKNYCKSNDVIHLLYVRRNVDDISQWRLPSEVAARIEQEAETAATALLQKYIDRAIQAHFQCRGRIVIGDEREEICKEVLWVCADVLIVGSRGLNRVQRVFLGSVSEYCAHHSACPVIIVKPSTSVRRTDSNDSIDLSSEMHIPGLDPLEET